MVFYGTDLGEELVAANFSRIPSTSNFCTHGMPPVADAGDEPRQLAVLLRRDEAPLPAPNGFFAV